MENGKGLKPEEGVNWDSYRNNKLWDKKSKEETKVVEVVEEIPLPCNKINLDFKIELNESK